MLGFEKEEACHEGSRSCVQPLEDPWEEGSSWPQALPMEQSLPWGSGTSPGGAGRCQPEGGVFIQPGSVLCPLLSRSFLSFFGVKAPGSEPT